jgi:NTE family protein
MTDVESTAAPPVVKKGINLALQGGGAHGAFTWGVLDYLLEDGRLAIEGISGASAGALNAVMVTASRAAAPKSHARAWPTSGAPPASTATCR